MRATDELKSELSSDWDAVINHAFCEELANGTLPLAKMKWYLGQDYLFIDQFVRLLASAIAHAPSLADSVPMAQFLAVITGPENTYFLRCFEALEMSEEEREPEISPAASSFQALMREAQHSGRYEQMLAVLVVAEWSYLSWAETRADYSDDLPFWFSEWIDLHSGEYFSSVVGHLRDQLDKVWPDLSQNQQAEVRNMFGRAVKCELDFFNASYSER